MHLFKNIFLLLLGPISLLLSSILNPLMLLMCEFNRKGLIASIAPLCNDLTSSYWQVRISNESQGITMFISEFGHFAWTVCPQGLFCSSDEFGQLLEIIVSKIYKFLMRCWWYRYLWQDWGWAEWSVFTFTQHMQGKSFDFIAEEISTVRSRWFYQVCWDYIVLERIISRPWSNVWDTRFSDNGFEIFAPFMARSLSAA